MARIFTALRNTTGGEYAGIAQGFAQGATIGLQQQKLKLAKEQLDIQKDDMEWRREQAGIERQYRTDRDVVKDAHNKALLELQERAAELGEGKFEEEKTRLDAQHQIELDKLDINRRDAESMEAYREATGKARGVTAEAARLQGEAAKMRAETGARADAVSAAVTQQAAQSALGFFGEPAVDPDSPSLDPIVPDLPGPGFMSQDAVGGGIDPATGQMRGGLIPQAAITQAGVTQQKPSSMLDNMRAVDPAYAASVQDRLNNYAAILRDPNASEAEKGGANINIQALKTEAIEFMEGEEFQAFEQARQIEDIQRLAAQTGGAYPKGELQEMPQKQRLTLLYGLRERARDRAYFDMTYQAAASNAQEALTTVTSAYEKLSKEEKGDFASLISDIQGGIPASIVSREGADAWAKDVAIRVDSATRTEITNDEITGLRKEVRDVHAAVQMRSKEQEANNIKLVEAMMRGEGLEDLSAEQPFSYATLHPDKNTRDLAMRNMLAVEAVIADQQGLPGGFYQDIRADAAMWNEEGAILIGQVGLPVWHPEFMGRLMELIKPEEYGREQSVVNPVAGSGLTPSQYEKLKGRR